MPALPHVDNGNASPALAASTLWPWQGMQATGALTWEGLAAPGAARCSIETGVTECLSYSKRHGITFRR